MGLLIEISHLLFLCLVLMLASQGAWGLTSHVKMRRTTRSTTLIRSSSEGLGPAEMGQPAALWSDRVEFVDLISGTVPEATDSTRELALFMLGNPFYPQGNNFLNVFEMKYRTMMFDCSQKDDRFGYIFSDPSGQIGSYGTVCRIVDRELLDDGRQHIAIEGESRFKVRRILKTLPYVVAEVDVNVEDEDDDDNARGDGDDEQCAELEREVYDTLKYYVRLMKEYPRTKKMMVTQAAKAHRPTASGSSNDNDNDNDNDEKKKRDNDDRRRRTAFSYSLANMIQMGQAREGQLLLQTRSTWKRLEAEKMILQSAVKNVEEQLVKIDALTPDRR